jgi:hypothetical protein
MRAHLISEESMCSFYDFTLYSEAEFAELLPGISSPAGAVLDALTKHDTHGVCFKPIQPDGSSTLDLLFSSLQHHPHRLPGGSLLSPCSVTIDRLCEALSLCNTEVQKDDLLLALLLIFDAVSVKHWAAAPEDFDDVGAFHIWAFPPDNANEDHAEGPPPAPKRLSWQ